VLASSAAHRETDLDRTGCGCQNPGPGDVCLFVRHFRILPLVLVMVLCSAGVAQAAPSSAIDQYQENIPAGAGKRGEATGKGKAKLAPSTRRGLEAQGPDGKALAEVIANSGGVSSAATASTPSSGGSTPAAAAGGSGGSAASAEKRSPVRTTVAASLESGFGPTKLWVMLTVILVGGLAVAVLRRKSA
jgi:hypothetical protein